MANRCTCDPGPDGHPHREWCAINDPASFVVREIRKLADDDAAVEAVARRVHLLDAKDARAAIQALADHLDGGAR